MKARISPNLKLTEFQGKLLDIKELEDGWYLLKIEDVPIPLRCHNNRISELQPQVGDLLHGRYDEEGEMWMLEIAEGDVVI